MTPPSDDSIAGLSRRSRARRLAAAGLIVALALAAWLLLAPRQLGGRVSYMAVAGSSMEPRLHRGDLAIVRSSSGYEPGEIVAYRSPELGRAVLHRIVERKGDRYVLKGDNNDFIDPAEPEQGDMVGRLWLRVPGSKQQNHPSRIQS